MKHGNTRGSAGIGWVISVGFCLSGCGVGALPDTDAAMDGTPAPQGSAPTQVPLAEAPRTVTKQLVATDQPYLFFAGCFEENSVCFSFPNRVGCESIEIVFDKSGQVCAACSTQGEKTFHCGLAKQEEVKKIFDEIPATRVSLSFTSRPGLHYADCADPDGCPALPNLTGCERLSVTLSPTEPPVGACQVKNALPLELAAEALPIRCSSGAANRHCEDLGHDILSGDAGPAAPLHAQLRNASGDLAALFDKLLNVQGAYAKAQPNGQPDLLQGFMKLIGDMYNGFVAAWPMIIKTTEWGLTIATPILGTVCKALNGIDYGITCIIADGLGVAAQVLPFIE